MEDMLLHIMEIFIKKEEFIFLIKNLKRTLFYN